MDIFFLLVGLHQKGSMPAACTAGLFKCKYMICIGSKVRSDFIEKQNSTVVNSKSKSKKTRRRDLINSSKIPEKTYAKIAVYKRNTDVIIEVLERSKGTCEHCGVFAPFLRKSDNSPYLEVHHKIRLADGGEDTVENAIAICPNCHRALHYG